MFEEVKELDRGTYGFSGDVAIGRTGAHTVTTMEDIEARCRRLIVSVDAPFETKPTISFTKGFAPIGQREKFLQDFNYGGISGIHCHNDQFCSFKYIKKCGGSIRFWIGRYRGVGLGFYLFSPDPGSGRGPNFTVETDKEESDYYHPVHLWFGRDGKLKVGRTKKRGYTDPRYTHPNADLTEYGSFDPVTCSPIAAEFADYESTKTYNSAVTSCKR